MGGGEEVEVGGKTGRRNRTGLAFPVCLRGQWQNHPHAHTQVRFPFRPLISGLTKPITIIAQGIKFYEPVRWCLEQIKWKVYTKASLPMGGGTTWAELALDFYAATRVPIAKVGQATPGTVGDQAKLFAVIARRAASLSNGAPYTSGQLGLLWSLSGLRTRVGQRG